MPSIKLPSGTLLSYTVPTAPSKKELFHKNRPTIIWLHPVLMDSTFWKPQLECVQLVDTFNMVLLDIPHHGGSMQKKVNDEPIDFWKMGDDLDAWMEKLDLERAHFFGNSLGAIVSMRFAIKYPHRVESLIACSKHADQTEDNLAQWHELIEAWLEGEEEIEDAPVEKKGGFGGLFGGKPHKKRDVPSVLATRGVFYIFFGEEFVDADVTEGWLKTWAERYPPSKAALCHKIFSIFVNRVAVTPAQLATITCPVLILHGTCDLPYPVDCAKLLYSRLVNAPREMHFVEGGAHVITWTHPDEINALAYDFFGRASGVLPGGVGDDVPLTSNATPGSRIIRQAVVVP